MIYYSKKSTLSTDLPQNVNAGKYLASRYLAMDMILKNDTVYVLLGVTGNLPFQVLMYGEVLLRPFLKVRAFFFFPRPLLSIIGCS